MTTQLQLRRDTTTNIGGITPAQGELLADITFAPPALVLGDGAQAGGWRVTPVAGAWTPQLEFGGAAVGMTGTFAGSYVQIGPLVFAWFTVILSAKGASTGAATITGLPISALSSNGQLGAVTQAYHADMNTSFVGEHFIADGATATITLGKSNDASNGGLADTDFTATSRIEGLAIYRAAWPTA